MLRVGDVIRNRTGRKYYDHKIVGVEGDYFVILVNGRIMKIAIFRANDKSHFELVNSKEG